ncbi:UNVERIFIED_CONTAM: hypothetical protein GTU68_021870 [Idotea baltica]|nr:hypothetical protein [Idotea baltica]
MYVCGPTVYDRAHLGNARPVVVFDTLFRLLRHVYGDDYVTYARNFTDVDDKINAKAAETGRSIRDITDETIGWYLEDMGALGAMEPSVAPRATEYIQQMIDMIKLLIERGYAYTEDSMIGHNSVREFKSYGELSGRNLDEMISGSRVEVAENKRDPLDFVLWKPSIGDEPGWESPWGYGRPGWHIEFDIHGGGIDLQFPHHENEIAQSCACGYKFARYWMHNEMLQVEGKKMSKSLGNFFTVRDLLVKKYSGEVIRFVMLSTHYSKPMDWTVEKAVGAEGKLQDYLRMIDIYADMDAIKSTPPLPEIIDALSDDLNTHAALTGLEMLANHARGTELAANLIFMGLYSYDGLMAKLSEIKSATASLVPIAARLHQLRLTAMETKNFTAVDEMKQALGNAGVSVKMSKEAVTLEPNHNFNPEKLESII